MQYIFKIKKKGKIKQMCKIKCYRNFLIYSEYKSPHICKTKKKQNIKQKIYLMAKNGNNIKNKKN